MHHGVNCRNGTCKSRAVDGCDLTTTGGEVTTPGLQGVRQTQHQASKVAVTPPITSLTQGEFLPADYSHPPTIPIRTEMELTCDITTSGGLTVNADLHADLGLEGKVAIVAGGGAAGDGIGLTRAMAVDHARDGIRVNCIAPGPVHTPMVYSDGMSDEAREQRRNYSLLGIEGTGWDAGRAVLFPAPGWARYITGQTLVVDGSPGVVAAVLVNLS